jgi:hypothetical protein
MLVIFLKETLCWYLVNTITTYMQTKKKRRDLFKDFVKFLVEQHRRQQGNSGMQDPSTALRTPKARRGLSGGTGSQQTSLLETEKDAYFAGLFDWFS